MIKSARLLLGVVLGVVSVLGFVASAQAATGYQRVGVFAQTANDGTGVVQTHNGRVAVKTSTGDVYETDTVSDRIDVYRPNGTDADPLTTFGTGDLTDPFGIAIDQSTGDVYVSDSGNSRVQKFISDNASTPTFTLDGTFTSPGNASALAFDQAAHELVYIDPSDPSSQQIRRDDTAGTAFNGDTSGAAFTNLQDLAVTSTGEIIVVDSTGNPAEGSGESRVERFGADGAHNGSLGPVAGAATVAVIPDGDRILVSGAQDAVNSDGMATVSLFASDGTLQSRLVNEEQYSIITGLAADDGADGRVYVAADNSPQYGYVYGNASVQAYEPFPLPTIGMPTISGVTGSSAHLSASVDPQGGSTAYRFEISTDASSWTVIDPDSDGDEDAGSGTGDVTVGADATDLAPNAVYYVRVIATKNGVGVTSGQAQFTSGLVVATVANPERALYQPYEDEAYLNARVNPRHAPASVHFDYGLTTAYGKSTDNQAVAAGDASVAITHHIRHLTPGTTYHFRMVATNGAGQSAGADQSFTTLSPAGRDACPNAVIRAQQHAQEMADCRAFEQVSPVAKDGISVDPGRTVQATSGGDAVAFSAPGAFAGASMSVLGGYYIARRSGTAWSSGAIDAPQDNGAGPLLNPSLFLSSDLASSVQFSSRALAGGVEGGSNVYLQDNLTGTRTLIASTPSLQLKANLFSPGARYLAGVTPDMSHFAFATQAGGLVPGMADGASQAYESVNGSVRLVSYLPDGSIAPSAWLGQGVAGAGAMPTSRPVSVDGRKIFFRAPVFGFGALYVRVDGQTTVPISVSQRTGGPSDPQPASFVGASEDGNIVYFESTVQLTNNDFSGLYRYDLLTGRLDLITRPADPNSAPGAPVLSVQAVSADGSTVYFVSAVNLGDGAPAGEGRNLYVWRNGELSFIGALGGNDSDATPNASMSLSGRFLEVALSGRPTGYDNDNQACGDDPDLGFSAGTCSEVFRYDADAKDLKCLSCLANAAESRHSHVGRQSAPPTISDYSRRAVLEDGRVYFSSSESLVPGDVNGAQDVYEWQNGVLKLLSGGRSAEDAVFVEASADGRDVFFTTTARLVRSDQDNENDLYDARQGGGLSVQNDAATVTAPCTEDGCQGTPNAPAGRGSVGSVTFSDGGNTPPVSGRSAAKSTKPVVINPKAVRGTSTQLRVKVAQKGVIGVSGAGLLQTRKAVAKAGTYRITMGLSQRSRRALARGRRVTVGVTVRFTPSIGRAGQALIAVTFKAANSTKKGRS